MYEFKLYDPLFLPHRGCDITLKCESGQSVLLLGENGLGKSTLLQRMREQSANASFLEQKSIEIFYDRKLSQLKDIFSQISPTLHKLRFERLWNEFGLDTKENRKLSQLSGGEAQALKICLSLSKDSDLYFLDEPSQNLDQTRTSVLNRHLKKLLEEGKSLIIVEHDHQWMTFSRQIFELAEHEKFLKVRQSWTT